MKRKLLYLISSILLISIFLISCNNKSEIKEIGATNLEDTYISVIRDDEISKGILEKEQGTLFEGKEIRVLPEDVFLIFNGSITDEFGKINENGEILIPFKKIESNLGVKSSSKDKNIIDNEYIALSDIKNVYNVDILDFTDELNKENLLTPGIKTILFSNYPKSQKSLSKAEATEILKNKLIEEYELFTKNKFEELKEKPEAKNGVNEMDEDFIRYAISNLEMKNEIDRFFITKIAINNLWVDKYTGDVFYFYDMGATKVIKKFEPKNIEFQKEGFII